MSEDPTDVRKELKGLLMKFHPDRLPQGIRNSDEISKILTELLSAATEGRSIRTWPDLDVDSKSPHKEGDLVHFVRQDDRGEVYEAEFRLPKWVRSFRKGLAAFSEGRSDEEVKNILNFDPATVDRKSQREMRPLIESARTINDLIKIQEDILRADSLLDASKRKLLREIAGKIAGAYSPLLQNATKLGELKAISRDVQELIHDASEAAREDKDYFLNILSMVIDARADIIGTSLLENADDQSRLERIAGYITAIYSFPFKDTGRKNELIRNGNELARSIFIEDMKRARSEQGLQRLHEYAYRFPFSPDSAGEIIRNEVLTWIEKKWGAYFSPNATSLRKNASIMKS